MNKLVVYILIFLDCIKYSAEYIFILFIYFMDKSGFIEAQGKDPWMERAAQSFKK